MWFGSMLPMPRYFIDTDDGDKLHIDDEGQILLSEAVARLFALDALPDMARDKIPDGDRRTFVVGVRDEAGEVFYRATLTLKGEWVRRNVGWMEPKP